eukprot:scaffold836_cov190-Chaetoceros_neogracile.AAC.1
MVERVRKERQSCSLARPCETYFAATKVEFDPLTKTAQVSKSEAWNVARTSSMIRTIRRQEDCML